MIKKKQKKNKIINKLSAGVERETLIQEWSNNITITAIISEWIRMKVFSALDGVYDASVEGAGNRD